MTNSSARRQESERARLLFKVMFKNLILRIGPADLTVSFQRIPSEACESERSTWVNFKTDPLNERSPSGSEEHKIFGSLNDAEKASTAESLLSNIVRPNDTFDWMPRGKQLTDYLTC